MANGKMANANKDFLGWAGPLDFAKRGKSGLWMTGLMERVGCERLWICKKYFQKSGENPTAGITKMRNCGKRAR
jgi:hypothetical protein